MTSIKPMGVKLSKTQTEYQLFPEEYFTATDCYVYFNDVWLDELTGLTFRLNESVNPIYGYASHTWDYVSRGKRLVQGQFSIAFKEAGYMAAILRHFSDLNGKNQNAIGHLLNEESVRPETEFPIGGIMDKIETILRDPGANTLNSDDSGKKMFSWNLPLKAGDTDALDKNKGLPKVYGHTTALRQLQTWLIEHGYQVAVTGSFDKPTTRAVKNFQQIIMDGADPSGIIDQKTMNRMSDIAQNRPSTFAEQDVGTGSGSGSNGIVQKEKTKVIPVSLDEMLTEYEQNIWGRPFVENAGRVRKHESFFYRPGAVGENEIDPMTAIHQEGFDIYINYGPFPQYIKAKLNKIADDLSFNTTVKAIRNIQITDVEQVLDARTGEPIEEIYSFIAQDMD